MVMRTVSVGLLAIAGAVALMWSEPSLSAQRIRPDGSVRFDPSGEIFTLTFEDGTTCTISVDLWVSGSWLLPIRVNGRQGAAVFKEGTPAERTWQVSDDIERYVNIIKNTFRDSADMRAKVKRACEARGGHIAVRLLQGDPNHVVAETFDSANLIVIDTADVEMLGNSFRTTDPRAARSDAGSNSIDMSLMFSTTVVAHEFDHMGGLDHKDPNPGDADPRGKPVRDENRVNEDLGWDIDRQNYANGFLADYRVNGFDGYIDFRPLLRNHHQHQLRRVPASVLPRESWDDLGLVPDTGCADGDTPGGGGRFCFPVDPDSDGQWGADDNCSGFFNPSQLDSDGDGAGDGCDAAPAGDLQERWIAWNGDPQQPLGRLLLDERNQRLVNRRMRLFVRRWGGVRRFDVPLAIAPPRVLDWTQAPSDQDIRGYVVSEGGASGEILRVVVINTGARDVEIGGSGLAFEPVRGLTEAQATRGWPAAGRVPRAEAILEAYCLDIARDPPAPGVVFRLAAAATQQAIAPVRAVLGAERRLAFRGALHPDSDPAAYRTSIAQWAVWTIREGFDERQFTDALVAHTRRNAAAAGATWTAAIEAAVRAAAPNRWRDIEAIVEESRREAPPAPTAAR